VHMWTVRGAVAIGLLVQAQALHYPDCRFTVSGGSTCITVCSQLSTYQNCLQHMCTDKQRTAETLAETCQTMTSKIAQLGCTCPRHCTFDGCLVNHDCTSWVCSGGGFVWLLINSVLLLGLLFVFYKCYNRYHNYCARQGNEEGSQDPTSLGVTQDSGEDLVELRGSHPVVVMGVEYKIPFFYTVGEHHVMTMNHYPLFITQSPWEHWRCWDTLPCFATIFLRCTMVLIVAFGVICLCSGFLFLFANTTALVFNVDDESKQSKDLKLVHLLDAAAWMLVVSACCLPYCIYELCYCRVRTHASTGIDIRRCGNRSCDSCYCKQLEACDSLDPDNSSGGHRFNDLEEEELSPMTRE